MQFLDLKICETPWEFFCSCDKTRSLDGFLPRKKFLRSGDFLLWLQTTCGDLMTCTVAVPIAFAEAVRDRSVRSSTSGRSGLLSGMYDGPSAQKIKTSFHFELTSFHFWLTSFRFLIDQFSFWSTSFHFWSTSFRFRSTSFRFWATSFQFWLTSFQVLGI
jgi:hypothetical protein